MFDLDLSQLALNPFISGGLTLMIVGAVLYYLKRLPGTVYNFIERFFIVKLEVLDEDEAYRWMQVWLAERLHKTLSISVVTRRNEPPDPDDDDPPEPHHNRPTVYFVPAVGTYFFWYGRRFVTLNRNREKGAGGTALVAAAGGDAHSPLRNKESFTLRIFSRDRDLARRLIEECRDRALPDDGRLDIRVASYGHWYPGARVKPRPLGSVILDGDQAGELLADMRAFLAGRGWYERVGVPYRRGYLLYGPPGNGKTSIVKALAGELGLSIYLLMLSDPDISDHRAADLLAKVPARAIVLLEDIDCAFTRRARADGKTAGLTFAGLLNAIDGVASPEGRIVVMTTNHLDRLDPALVRPGRADVKLLFGNATSEQAGRLFARFFPDRPHLAGDFAARVEGGRYSMAALQDYLMLHRRDPEEAIRRAGEIDTLQLGSTLPDGPSGRSHCGGDPQANGLVETASSG
jgi:chaperone BCS1